MTQSDLVMGSHTGFNVTADCVPCEQDGRACRIEICFCKIKNFCDVSVVQLSFVSLFPGFLALSPQTIFIRGGFPEGSSGVVFAEKFGPAQRET